MAILKDLIVHGSSRFLNKIYASEIQTPLIEAEAGVFKKLKADDATIVGLLDVQGQMHTNSWTNSNIATIDGSFYITPTLSSSSGTVSFSSATAATFTGSYAAVSSLYVGNNTASTVQWTSGSKILITGQVQVNGEWTPLGTLLGTLNSTNPTTSMPVVSITDNRNNTSNILTDIYSLKGNASLSYRNLKVSLYQRADSSKYYPLGIFMTALGQNGKTFLDIYGGVNELTTSYGGYANPNVRIGNLSGLPAITTAAGNFTPVGWGIYTTNGYFSGTIVSNTGVIGGWKLGASSLYNGTTGLNNTTAGIYLGTDGIRNYKDTDTYVNITQGVITAKGVNLTGQINATAGNIGGASITGGTLIVGNANINDINASKINAGDIAAARIQTNLISAINAKVSDLSALTATIGGFQIDSSSIHTNNIAVTSNTDNSIALSSADFTRTINNTSRTGLRFAIGDKFGVTGDGTIYASNVDLTGKITATSGTIGGIQLDGNGKLWITDANISGTISGSHIDASSISIGNLNGASNYAQKTDVTQAIDNIEIGGRNLLRYDVKNYAFSASKITEGTAYRGMYASIEEGKTYTISRKIIEGNRFRLYTTQTEPAVNVAAQPLKVDDDSLLKYTFIAPSNANYLFIYLSNQSDNISNGNIKLEIGNKATDWTPAPEDTQESINNVSTTANTALSQSVWYAECSTNAAITYKEAEIVPTTTAFSLQKGVSVNVKFSKTNTGSISSLELNINNTGSKPIKYINNGTLSTLQSADHIKAGNTYNFIYDGTNWIIQLNYFLNTIGTYGGSKVEAGTTASGGTTSNTIFKYTLLMKNKVGASPTWVSLVTSSSTATSKTRYTGGLYPDQVLYYSGSNNYKTGSQTGNLFDSNQLDFRYSSNSGSTLIEGRPVYLVGTLNDLDGLFYLNSTWWTQTEPTYEDGNLYIYLGMAYSSSQIILNVDNPQMLYYEGAFRTLTEANEMKAAKTATSYITYIDAENGIKIHNSQDTLNYLQLNSTAISMYRDKNGSESDEVLRIDDSGIRIGKNEGPHFSLTDDKLIGYGDIGNVYFEVGKGDNTTIQLFYGNGERTSFEIGPLFKTIYYVKKNNVDLISGTDYEIHVTSVYYNIYFKTEPTLNSTISVTYKDFYKSFIYTISSSSSGDITVTSQQGPWGTTTVITIQTHKSYEAESIYYKKSGTDYWQRWTLEAEEESGTYKYSFHLGEGVNVDDQIKLNYSTEEHTDLIPDTATENYTWDATYQNSTLLTIPSASQILSVSINNIVLTENEDYTLDGLLKYGYLILYNAPAINEKIEIKLLPEEYNFEYQPTYFNFSNTNLENSIKGIGASSFGSKNVNKGIFCFAEGAGNIVTGYASHVEGHNNIAAGSHSHVGGSNSLALGQNTFAYGDNLQATYLNSAAFGFYNSPENQLFSIGKGGYENAFSVNKDGNVQIGGRLLAGTTYTNNKPLFIFDTLAWTGQSIRANGSWIQTAYQLTRKPGYKAIAVAGVGIYNGSGGKWADYCIPIRCYVWSASPYDLLDVYIWNQYSSATVNTSIYIKILFIADTAF